MAYREGIYLFHGNTFLEFIEKEADTPYTKEQLDKPIGTMALKLWNVCWRIHIRLANEESDSFIGEWGYMHYKDADTLKALNLPPEIEAQMLLMG